MRQASVLMVALLLFACSPDARWSVVGVYDLDPYSVRQEDESGAKVIRVVSARLELRLDGTFQIPHRIEYMQDGSVVRTKRSSWTGRWKEEGGTVVMLEARSTNGPPELEHHKVLGMQWRIHPDGRLTGDSLGKGLVYRRVTRHDR